MGTCSYRFLRIAGNSIAVWLIAAILFWSGSEHLKNPFAFLSSVLRYDLIRGFAATFVAMVLPSVQIVLAALLILRFRHRETLLVTATLLTMFVLLQGSALLRGLDIRSGCFGAGNDTPISWWSIAKTASLAGIAWALFASEPNAPIDRVAVSP